MMSIAGHQALTRGMPSSTPSLTTPLLLWLVTLSFVMTDTFLTGQGLAAATTHTPLEFRYRNHGQMARVLKQFNVDYPKITRLHFIGKSHLGRALWVLVIGTHARKRKPLVPNVKYIANMHGNEVVGRVLLLHLAEYYLTRYNTNRTIKNFLDTTTVHLMPTMNPDGHTKARANDCLSIWGRGNIYNYDLNRNFPDPYMVLVPPEQKEMKLVRKWIHETHFVLSANLHGGAEVVNYPWDSLRGDMKRADYAITPDDDVFRHLALTYSRSHPTMHLGTSCGDNFENGITNGADWYPVLGGMADYTYRNGSGYELLIEMSCCKYPDVATLPDFWSLNKDALINLHFAVHMGVKGIVQEGPDQPLQNAQITVMLRSEIVFWTTVRGEFFKLLLPGDYVLKVALTNYTSRKIPFTVHKDNVTVLIIDMVHVNNTEIEPKPTPETTSTSFAITKQDVTSTNITESAGSTSDTKQDSNHKIPAEDIGSITTQQSTYAASSTDKQITARVTINSLYGRQPLRQDNAVTNSSAQGSKQDSIENGDHQAMIHTTEKVDNDNNSFPQFPFQILPRPSNSGSHSTDDTDEENNNNGLNETINDKPLNVSLHFSNKTKQVDLSTLNSQSETIRADNAVSGSVNKYPPTPKNDQMNDDAENSAVILTQTVTNMLYTTSLILSALLISF